MKCYYYRLFFPIRDIITDTGPINVGFEADCADRDLKIALLQYEDCQLKALRYEIFGLKEKIIPLEIWDIIYATQEHFLSVVRMNYDLDCRYDGRPMWNFVEDNQDPTFSITSQTTLSPPNLELLKNVFVNGMPYRSHLRMLADGIDPHLPLTFRYLSLYKIIEYRFKSKGHWLKKDFRTFLAPYNKKIQDKGIAKELLNLVHDIRDRCAHVKTNSDKFALTHLNRSDAVVIEEIMPVMIEIAAAILNAKAEGKVTILKRGEQPPNI